MIDTNKLLRGYVLVNKKSGAILFSTMRDNIQSSYNTWGQLKYKSIYEIHEVDMIVSPCHPVTTQK